MHIDVSLKTEYRPFRWSFDYCVSCEQEGPSTIEHILEVVYLYGFRAGETRIGKIARCDFCRRHIENPRTYSGIELDEWLHAEGLSALLAKLDRECPVPLPETTTEARLHSLLSAVERASALQRQPLSPIGIVAGGVAGAVGAIPLGMWLYESHQVQPKIDELGFVMGMILAGVFVGMLLGAAVEYFLRRGPDACARIETAHTRYGIDLERLEQASQSYSRRIRNAVKKLCEKAILRDGSEVKA